MSNIDHWSPVQEIADVTGLSQYAPGHIPDERCFDAFQQAYLEYVEARDSELRRELLANSECMRGALQFTPRTVLLAQELCWYYDELLVPDPLHHVFSNGQPDNERCRQALLTNFRALETVKKPLSEGFLLLRNIRQAANGDPLAAADSIAKTLNLDELLPHALEETEFGMNQPIENELGRWHEFRLCLRNVRKGGWKVQLRLPPGQHSSPPIDLWANPPTCTRIELESAGVDDIDIRVREMIPIAAVGTISFVGLARELNATPVFDKSFDAEVLSQQPGQDSVIGRMRSQVTSHRFLVPFITGASLSALLTARAEAPDSFKNMKAELSEMARKCPEGDPEEVQHWLNDQVDRTIRPKLNQLEADLKKAATLSAFKGVGGSSVLLLGTLACMAVQAPQAALITSLAAAGKTMVDAIGERRAAKEGAKGSPWYFLWRARS